MKHSIILSSAIFLLVAGACKKNNMEPTIPTGTPKIKTEIYVGSNPTTYEYDGQGRRTQMIYGNGEKIVYTYVGNTCTQKLYDNSGNYINQQIHELNDSGYVIKTTYGGADPGRITYQYNANWQLVNQHYFTNSLSDSSDWTWFYSPQGRLDSFWSTRNNNTVIISKQYYEYAIDKPDTYSPINTGLLLYGKQKSKNPPTKITKLYYQPVTQQVLILNYEYDAYNRITRVTDNMGSQGTLTYY